VPESFSSSVEDDFVVEHDVDVDDDGGGSDEEAEDEVPWLGAPTENTSNKVIKGFPPVAPFIGVTPTLCYLLRDKKPLCCLQLAQV